MSPSLSVVSSDGLKRTTPTNETVAQRVKRLQAEVASLSREQVVELLTDLRAGALKAAEIADNPAQPPGIRDLARRLVEEVETRVETIVAINARS